MTATKAAHASDELTRALINLAARGQRTHCSDPGTSELWLSEHKSDRAQAARMCAGCPVIEPCGQAAEAKDERFGVWAGCDRTRPPGKPPNPTTRRPHEMAAEDLDALQRLMRYVENSLDAQDVAVGDQLRAALHDGLTSLRIEESALSPVVVVTIRGLDVCEVSLSRLVDLDE
jgi:hypothetical protein